MKLTKRKGFNFFRSYYDVYNELEKPTDKLAFIDALLNKQFQGVDPVGLKGMAKFAWVSQINSIDSQVKGYETKTGLKLTPCQGGVNTPTPQVQVQVQVEEKGEVQYVIGFDDFWKAYGKSRSKKKAEMKWNKLSEEVKAKIMDHVPLYVKSTPDKQLRKDPMTYLNNESWEDEIILAKTDNKNLNKNKSAAEILQEKYGIS